MSNKNKHILVVSQYFYPEQFRINDICSEWVKRGYKVTVLTGIPNYPQGKYYKGYGLFKKISETYMGIDIIRIPICPRGNNLLILALNYLSFVISGFFWVLFSKLKSDYVFIYEVSPMSQALPGIWYAKKRSTPCYIYVTDLWPESVEIVGGIKNKYILKLLNKMVDYIYRNCDRIFTSSKSFVKEINKRKVPLDKIEFWPQYAEDYYKPLSSDSVSVPEIPRDDFFNIIFAGNIGGAQGLDILPKTAKILMDKNIKARFNIVGDGRYKENLIAMVKKYKVEKMFNFVEKQPAKRIPEFMSASDASLICLGKSKIFAKTIPAKTQSCFACGIPIIVSADGEIQDIINESEAGICSTAGNEKELAKNIEKIVNAPKGELLKMSNNALKYYQKQFEKEATLKIMDSWFNKNKKR
jgi:glycosyltransferase involved in cell wall biosynthesis